jgi:hypothetical protein
MENEWHRKRIGWCKKELSRNLSVKEELASKEGELWVGDDEESAPLKCRRGK